MKQNPVFQIVKYIAIFRKYLGNRIFIIFILVLFSALSEAFGIAMFLPLLKQIGNTAPHSSDELYSEIERENELFGVGLMSLDTNMILLVIGLAFFTKGLLTFLALAVESILKAKLFKKLTSELYSCYSDMTYEYYATNSSGHFSNIINEQISKALLAFYHLVQSGSMVVQTVIYVALAIYIDWKFGILIAFSGTMIIVAFKKLNIYMTELSRISASERSRFLTLIINFLATFKYLRSSARTNVLDSKVKEVVDNLTVVQRKISIAAAFTHSAREPIAVVIILIIVAFHLSFLQSDLEPIFVSIILFYRASNSMFGAQSYLQASLGNIGSLEILDTEFENQKQNINVSSSKNPRMLNNSIIFNNVSFQYPGMEHETISNIDLVIPKNKTIVFIGETGSGKSTLLDLISLLIQPTSGSILIDGVESSDINNEFWQKNLGIVMQENVIYNDTIANNIWMRENFQEKKTGENEKLLSVLKKLKMNKFVDELPQKANTIIGDGAVSISGGQKQRISIARELMKSPQLLLLDEATSSLDRETELTVQKTIDDLKGKCTIVIVAHRLSTIKNADIVYVIANGKISETGTYVELTVNPDSYLSKLLSQNN
ncbi:ABC transporter ATP-binding protein/permease [Paracoccaceae bacterium]|nr:ABC transporter ATP-binding protein/permease [Paracoccaceae bacterium]